MKKRTLCLFKMMKDSDTGNSVVESKTDHRCGLSCLGPLIFHCQAVGDRVSLSQGGRLAKRKDTTFKNGLVFSSRPLRVQERIRLRVERDSHRWHGALRVGFTSVNPICSLPLPPMAIPDLTDRAGHWAAPVHQSYCKLGSEFEFWVSKKGTIYVDSISNGERKLISGVDISQPLWAIIDVYGQTSSILLRGSEKRGLITMRSCPAPECLTSFDVGNHSLILNRDMDECICCLDMEVSAGTESVMNCVVCMTREVRITLPCGHRCLCGHCAPRVIHQFGTCPLCRQMIRAPSVD